MGTSVGSLYVELSLQAENFNNGLKAAQKEAKEMEKTLKPLKQTAEDTGKAFTLVGGAVTASMLGMVVASATAGEQLNKFSIQTGISTQQLAGLQLAAEQNETSFEAMGIGLKKMSTLAVSNADAFKRIGVDVHDSSGAMLPMIEILKRTSDRFHDIPDGVQKSALAVQLFGKSGVDLIPTLNLGRKGLEEMQGAADKLGLSIGGDDARAGDNFKDTLGQIEKATLGLSNAVAGALMPELTAYAGILRDGIVAAKDFAKEHQGVTSAVFDASAALTGTGGLLLGLTAVVSIYPKVVAGLNAIGLSLGELGAAAAGATIGILAGEMINAAIAGTTLEHQLDAVTGSLVKPLQYLGLWADGTKLVAEQEKAQAVLLADNRTRLHALGIEYDFTKKSQAQMVQETNKLLIAAQLNTSALKKQTDGFHILTEAEQKQIEIDAKYRQAQADLYAKQVKNAQEFVNKWLEGFEKVSAEADKFTDSIERQEVATSKLAETSVDAAVVIAGAMVHAHDAWDEANQKTMTSGAKLFNQINELRETDLDKQVEYLTKRVKIEDQMMNRSIADYERMGDEFAATFARMDANIAASFAAMVVHGKFSMDALKSIAGDTAQSMLSSFIKGLISPLTNELTKLGAKLGDVISGALGIGGAVPHLPGGAAGPVLTTGGAGLGSTIAGLATNPYTIAIAAGLAVFTAWEKSQAHHEANTFVKTLQDPLVNNQGTGAINTIADEFFRQANAGTLTTDDAQTAIRGVSGLLSDFDANATKFAAGGKDEALVARQGRATIDPFVKDLLAQMQARAVNATPSVVVNVQGNVMPGMQDMIVAAVLEALQTNRGGLATALA